MAVAHMSDIAKTLKRFYGSEQTVAEVSKTKNGVSEQYTKIEYETDNYVSENYV